MNDEICGVVISIRAVEDILSVWTKTADDVEAANKIRDQIRRVLRLPNHITMEYKKHQDSITDKSSFRNTTVFRPYVHPHMFVLFCSVLLFSRIPFVAFDFAPMQTCAEGMGSSDKHTI